MGPRPTRKAACAALSLSRALCPAIEGVGLARNVTYNTMMAGIIIPRTDPAVVYQRMLPSLI